MFFFVDVDNIVFWIDNIFLWIHIYIFRICIFFVGDSFFLGGAVDGAFTGGPVGGAFCLKDL